MRSFAVYSVTRYFVCMGVAFVPRRVANAVLDSLLATFWPNIDEPIVVTDLDGNQITL